MKKSFFSSLVLLVIVAVSSSGCGDTKRAKECADRCIRAAETCKSKREANCEERGKACGERCERNAEYSF